ncbi:MAG: hypothetical protein MJZ82_04865 [Paludibacteraceae bacterium]|nr:hypothetical protein [Paludibacteraceae bacterium]
MKKTLLLIALMGCCHFGFAANEYQAVITSPVVVTDYSRNNRYEYKIEFDQKGSNSNGSWNTSVTLYIFPDNAGLTGTYNLTNGKLDADRSYIYFADGNPTDRYFIDYNETKITEISFTPSGDSAWTLTGSLRSNPKSNFYYYYYYSADSLGNTFTPQFVIPDPYELEPAETVNDTINAVATLDKEPYELPLVVYATTSDWSQEIELLFNTDTFDLPEGDYTIDTAVNAFSIRPADGQIVDFYANPSYYATYVNFEPTYYFLTSGTLHIDYRLEDMSMHLTGDLGSAHGSGIRVNLAGNDEFAFCISRLRAMAIDSITRLAGEEADPEALSVVALYTDSLNMAENAATLSYFLQQASDSILHRGSETEEMDLGELTDTSYRCFTETWLADGQDPTGQWYISLAIKGEKPEIGTYTSADADPVGTFVKERDGGWNIVADSLIAAEVVSIENNLLTVNGSISNRGAQKRVVYNFIIMAELPATDLIEAEGANDRAEKLILNGEILIVKGAEVYRIDGSCREARK